MLHHQGNTVKRRYKNSQHYTTYYIYANVDDINAKKFVCHLCDKDFSLEVNLKRHISNTHNKEKKILPQEIRECDICGKTFSTKGSLIRHITNQHMQPNTLHGCFRCGMKFKYIHNYRRHLRQQHQDSHGLIGCSKCGRKFKHVRNYKIHLRKQHQTEQEPDESGECEVNDFNKYYKRKKKSLLCDICGKQLSREDKLRHHVNNHTVKSTECELCHTAFSSYSSCQRHVETVHADYFTRSYICEFCGKQLSRQDILRRHVSKMHRTSVKNFECHHCNLCFHTKEAVRRHIVLIHLENQDRPKSFKCILCSSSFPTEKVILKHLEVSHQILVENETLEFEDEEQFQNWKADLEKRTWCSYVKNARHKTASSIHVQYRCHRSGQLVPLTNRKRRLKTLGSKKMEGFCPSKIKMYKMEDGAVEVLFVKTHVGHPLDYTELSHIRFSKSERNIIAQKVAAGIPVTQIMNDMTTGIKSAERLEKLNLLTKHDISNVARSKNISYVRSERSKNRPLGVKSLFIQTAERQKTDSVSTLSIPSTNEIKDSQEYHAEASAYLSAHKTTILQLGDGCWIVDSLSKEKNTYIVSKNGECGFDDCKITCDGCGHCSHEFRCTCALNMFLNIMCKHVHLLCLVQLRESENRLELTEPVEIGTTEECVDTEPKIQANSELTNDIESTEIVAEERMFENSKKEASVQPRIEIEEVVEIEMGFEDPDGGEVHEDIENNETVVTQTHDGNIEENPDFRIQGMSNQNNLKTICDMFDYEMERQSTINKFMEVLDAEKTKEHLININNFISEIQSVLRLSHSKVWDPQQNGVL